MPRQSAQNLREKAVRAALSLAAERGWENTGLQDIAQKSGIPLPLLRDCFEDRFDILACYGRMLDRRVMEAIGAPEPGTGPRDRLFDILMERLDVLNEDRDAVQAILRTFKCDPKQAVIALPHLGRSMSWMLEAAGIETAGLRGAIKTAGLAGLYLNILRIWAEDESEDMGKTMAALDRSLERAERLATGLGIAGA